MIRYEELYLRDKIYFLESFDLIDIEQRKLFIEVLEASNPINDNNIDITEVNDEKIDKNKEIIFWIKKSKIRKNETTTLIDNPHSFLKYLSKKKIPEKRMLVQKFYKNPFLLKGHKIDLRCLLVLMRTKNDSFTLWFNKGYFRRAVEEHTNEIEGEIIF